MKVLIGTTNPGKIQGAKEALDVFFKDADLDSYTTFKQSSPTLFLASNLFLTTSSTDDDVKCIRVSNLPMILEN